MFLQAHLRISRSWLIAAFLLANACHAIVSAETYANLNHKSSWVGNSFGGGYSKDKWVQIKIADIAVHPDGRVFTASTWDEAKKEYGIYKDGAVWDNGNSALNGTKTGGFGTDKNDRPQGKTLAIDCSRGILYAPVSGKDSANGDSIIGTWGFNGTPLPMKFPLSFIPLGISCFDTILAASGPTSIVLFSTKSGARVRTITALDSLSKILFDNDGDLWAIHGSDVSELTTTGTAKRSVPKVSGWDPVSIAFTRDDKLLVADNGTSKQIHIFDVSAQTPVLSRSLGEWGGIGSGTPGEVTPTKFWGITGCGSDSAGNVYVSFDEAGSAMKSFTPQGALRWELYGLHSIDLVWTDATTDAVDLYGAQEHYTMDYSKPAGKQWTLKGYTLDIMAYPQDPRPVLGSHDLGLPFIRYFGGKRFMFVSGMTGDMLMIYRFKGEVAVPSGALCSGSRSWAPNSPANDWIWIDANGNGAFDKGEFTTGQGMQKWAWWVSGNCSIWSSEKQSIFEYPPAASLDSHGNLVYAFATRRKTAAPNTPVWETVQRVIYDSRRDVAILSGYTGEHSRSAGIYGMNRSMGPVVARYDHWSTTRDHTWTTVLEYAYSTKSFEDQLQPRGFDWTGDYFFVSYESFGPSSTSPTMSRGEVTIHRIDNGTKVGYLLPGQEIGGPPPTPGNQRPTIVGAMDVFQPIHAFKRRAGTYLIFQEEDKYGKVMFYEWCPDTSCATESSVLQAVRRTRGTNSNEQLCNPMGRVINGLVPNGLLLQESRKRMEINVHGIRRDKNRR